MGIYAYLCPRCDDIKYKSHLKEDQPYIKCTCGNIMIRAIKQYKESKENVYTDKETKP